MTMLLGIDHATLLVRSLERSKEYYERIFGFTCWERRDSPGTLVLESEHVHFFLVEDADAPDEYLRKQHISFQVENLDQAMERLRRLGVTEYETGKVAFFQNRNYAWCEWRDPDGIRLEFVQSQ